MLKAATLLRLSSIDNFVYKMFRYMSKLSVWIREEDETEGSLCVGLITESTCALCLGVHDNSSVPFELRKF